MQLIDYWPTRKNVNECIRTEAETLSESVFLAVHQPVSFLKRSIGEEERLAELKSENDLLDFFLTDNLPSGTLLMPIAGSSGIGKSHTVRWIDAQLRRGNKAERLHIIRIPKSASLKRVLELILTRLEGKAFDDIRKELLIAHDSVDPLAATINLRANMRIALEGLRKDAESKIQEARSLKQKPSEETRAMVTHCRQDCLQALLDDPETGKWFIGDEEKGSGLLRDLAQRVIEGYQGDAEQVFQFTEQDLTFDESINLTLASSHAQKYYNLINMSNGKHRGVAVDILNQAIDGALAQLLNLNNNQLTDLFVRVREELLKQGKELILLIEDFAALAGVQGSLLDVVIREGVRDGRKVLCTMRTALAVTEGYITNRDTVRTRAQFEWLMKDVPHSDPDMTVSAIVNMVGAYLNAARFGQKELDERFNADGADLGAWIPDYDVREDLEEEDRHALAAFGYCKNKRALFPLCQNAIRQYTEKYLTNPDGDLSLNPRVIINHIIRPLLIDHRRSFEEGRFPDPSLFDFDPAQITAEVRNEVQVQVPNSGQKQRYYAFLRFWGNKPSTLTNLNRINEGLYHAFGLKPLKADGAPSPQPLPIDPVQTPTPPSSPEDMFLGNWQVKLDNWASGHELGQSDAHKLREWIVSGVSRYIDWDAALLKNPGITETYYKRWVYIPGARGGVPQANQDNAMVTVCRDGEQRDPDKSAEIILTLLAVVRYNHHKTWDYEDSEKDFIRYANLMKKSSRQALVFVKERYFKAKVDIAPVLAQAMLLCARVLNLPGATCNTNASIMKAMTARLDNVTTYRTDGSEKWRELVKHCVEARIDNTNKKRPLSLFELLLRQVGARQGGADGVWAVDAIRLLELVQSFLDSWRLEIPPFKNIDSDFKIIAKNIRNLESLVDAAIPERSQKMRNWRKKMVEMLGDKPDKKELLDTAEMVLSNALQSDVSPRASSYRQLKDSVRNLKDCKLMENFNLAGQLENSDWGKSLSLLAKTDEKEMEQTEKCLDMLNEFMDGAISELETGLQTAPENMVGDAEKNVEYVLNELVALSEKMEKGSN